MFKLDCLAVEFINYLLNRGGFQFKFSIYRYRIWCTLDVISLSTSALDSVAQELRLYQSVAHQNKTTQKKIQ